MGHIRSRAPLRTDLGQRDGQRTAQSLVTGSAFGFHHDQSSRRLSRDRPAIKYAIMIVGLSFATCLPLRWLTGTQPAIMHTR